MSDSIKSIQNRIHSLDLLRGIAVLGILLMNITAFSQVGTAYLNPHIGAGLEGYNKYLWSFNWLFADMKFMSLFSILFGAGIVLFADNIEAKGLTPWKWKYKRLFFLFIFGMIHAYFIWSGDILVAYSICGSFVFLFRKLKLRTLGIIALILFSIPIFIGLSLHFFVPLEKLLEIFRFWNISEVEIQTEVQSFISSYSSQIPYRVNGARNMQTIVFISESFWRISALMMLGIILYRSKVLTAQRSTVFYKKLAGFGLVSGLLFSSIGLYYGFQLNWSVQYTMIFGRLCNYVASIPVALGYIALAMLFSQSNMAPRLKYHLQMTGRMAFTNYIGMSVICSLIFFNLKLYNQVDRLEQLVIVFIIWTIMLLASPFIIKHFRYGPLEWFWRKLTYWNIGKKY